MAVAIEANKKRNTMTRLALTALILAAAVPVFAQQLAPDSSQWGGSPARNNAPATGALPAEWDVGQFEPRTGRWHHAPLNPHR